MATHSIILAWRTPWPEEPDWLQSTGLQIIGYNLVTEHACAHIRAHRHIHTRLLQLFGFIFVIPYKFQDCLFFYFCEKCHQNFDIDCFESVHCFRYYGYFNIINFYESMRTEYLSSHLCFQFLSSMSYSFQCIDLSLPVPASFIVCQCRRCSFDLWVGKIPWRRKWQATPVFLPEKSNGQRSLVGYRPRGCKELDTTGRLNNNKVML